MGTKSAAKKGHRGEELKNNDIDSSLVGVGEGFSVSNNKEKKKKKNCDAKSNDSEICAAEIEGVNVEVDVSVNYNEMEKEKKRKNKKKRKSVQSNVDVDSCKSGKQDKATDSAGDVTVIAETEVDFEEGQIVVGVDMGPHASEAGKDRKKNHKVRKSKDKNGSSSSVPNVVKNNLRENVDEGREVSGREDDSEMNKEDDGGRKRKKNRKTKIHGDGANAQVITSVNDRKEVESGRSNCGKNIIDSVNSPQKERKKKKQQSNVDGEATSPIIMAETPANKCTVIEEDGTNMDSAGNETRERKLGASALNKDEKRKRKKRKREHEMDKGIGAANSSEKSTPKGTSKRVSFSEEVEVFSSSDGPSDEGSVQEKELVRGKRFSPQEDEMVKEAVLTYIDNHGLGEEGITMVMNCQKYPEVKNCWKEIGAVLPWRPYESVYYRAHILFQRAETRSWTEEEYEFVLNYQEKHGSKWKDMADALGKHRFHVKDTWRRIKLSTEKKGKWSQDEYQNLFDLVNMDLRMKALEEVRKSKHGMLRDNICWTAISEKLGTRSTPVCCMKWYNQLTSPMVAEGKWLDVDDYHLLIALYDLDACCMEDVDWDSLLDHRPGDICRQRWNQMVKHLGNKSFAEQVEVLIGRYCPDVLEAREAYYSKPLVP